MTPLRIRDFTLTTSLGQGRRANLQKLLDGESGLQPCHFHQITDLPTWVGEVADVNTTQLPAALNAYDCRNNRLAWLALQQDNFINSATAVIRQYGKERVGVFIGTSTSGIYQTELAYLARDVQGRLPDWYHYQQTHNVYSVADFVQRALGTSGLCLSISTACSSSAKVFASASRAIQNGLCDAAIVGGVDSLCLTTLYGFHSLQLVSSEKCRPFDAHRDGISIGEAGGFALLEKNAEAAFSLLGYGESGDAYHMSSPHPEGEGAELAMQMALHKAGLSTSAIDYINLHGTGTPANDSAESKAVERLFGCGTPASSTKGWTGHTLGAAGIVETGFSLLALQENFIPQNLHLDTPDAETSIDLPRQLRRQTLRNILSNSFGFGGSNCSVILGETP